MFEGVYGSGLFGNTGEAKFSRMQASIPKNGLADGNHQWATCY